MAGSGKVARAERLSGIGFIGSPEAVIEKIDALVDRYGLGPARGPDDGATPVSGGCTGRLIRLFSGSGRTAMRVGGYYLAREPQGWTLSLFTRSGGRLKRVRSVALGAGTIEAVGHGTDGAMVEKTSEPDYVGVSDPFTGHGGGARDRTLRSVTAARSGHPEGSECHAG